MKSVVQHLFSRPGHRQGMSSFTMCAAVVALAMSACGSSDDSPPGSSTGDSGGTSQADASDDLGTFHTTPFTCTKPNTVCLKMQLPSTMDAAPVRLTFNYYDSDVPPVTPPIKYAGVFNSPPFTAGQTVYFELSDAGLAGNYWIYSIMYMPNGGFGPPVLGVDYIQRAPTGMLQLNGTPLNHAEPVVLSK